MKVKGPVANGDDHKVVLVGLGVSVSGFDLEVDQVTSISCFCLTHDSFIRHVLPGCKIRTAAVLTFGLDIVTEPSSAAESLVDIETKEKFATVSIVDALRDLVDWATSARGESQKVVLITDDTQEGVIINILLADIYKCQMEIAENGKRKTPFWREIAGFVSILELAKHGGLPASSLLDVAEQMMGTDESGPSLLFRNSDHRAKMCYLNAQLLLGHKITDMGKLLGTFLVDRQRAMDGYARQLEVADKKSEIRVVMSSGPANCDMLDYLTESGITMYELAKSYLTGSNVIKEIVEAAVEKVLKRLIDILVEILADYLDGLRRRGNDATTSTEGAQTNINNNSSESCNEKTENLESEETARQTESNEDKSVKQDEHEQK